MAEEGILHDGIYRVGDVRVSDLAGRKRLPIGDSVFESVVGNKVYIDKSMLIAMCSTAGPWRRCSAGPVVSASRST